MKNIIILLFSFFAVHSYAQNQEGNHLQKMENISNSNKQDTITVAVLLYDDVVLQDFAGPIEVFDKAQNLTKGKFRTFTVGCSSNEIHTENNLLKIKADYTLEHFPNADYIIIPGASMPVIEKLMENESLKAFLRKENADPKTKIVSICTASYLLAKAGILDGKKATTHFFVADDFEEKFSKIHLVRNVRFVDEGKVITSSGVTSGIDAALYIVGQYSGAMIQGMINRALQYTYGQNETWPTAPNGMRYRNNK